METTLELMSMSVVHQHESSIADLTKAIREADSIADLREARARVEAVKAWAKVHGLAKQVRLDLLKVEVEALVRIIELGGADILSPSDRRAAEWLAEKSPAERSDLIDASGAASTAVGMCKSIWREAEVREHLRQGATIGRHLAEEPGPPSPFDQDAIRLARRKSHAVSGALAKICDSYIANGVSFTIEEMADEIIHESAISEDLAEDDAIQKGVREVCREAVRRSPPLTINGTKIPRLITAREGGRFLRIPVMNATISHLADMILMRQEQLRQDSVALRGLEDFEKRLRNCPGATDEARIGALISHSIAGAGAEMAAS